MDFDEDCSSETEFDVDSCSETDYCAMSKRYPSVHEDDHYGIQATKSRKRSTEKNDSDQMKQAIRECRSHAVRGANVYPLEYFGAPLLAEKFPLSANEKCFLEFTGTSDPKVARQYLDMTEGYLDVAVATYVDREVPCTPPSMVCDANASLVSLLEDLDSDSNEFTSSLEICVSLSVDDGDQKLPAARPAVLSTAVISSSWYDDHYKGGLNEINGDQKLPAARPAVLSTAAISSSCDDDHNDNDGGLNEINGMSEYELKRMRNITRNNARLASLGLLVPMTSATTLFSDRPSRKKRVVPQDDVERRVQPKRNAKKPTS
jgi:hypothetical protein